jgi:hypothetical protein
VTFVAPVLIVMMDCIATILVLQIDVHRIQVTSVISTKEGTMMNSILLRAFLGAALVFGIVASSMASELSGSWINADPDSDGLSNIVISQNNEINVSAHCALKDCDWGAVSGQDKDGKLSATFPFDFKKVELSLVQNSDGTLSVSAVTEYNSGDRSNREEHYKFLRN